MGSSLVWLLFQILLLLFSLFSFFKIILDLLQFWLMMLQKFYYGVNVWKWSWISINLAASYLAELDVLIHLIRIESCSQLKFLTVFCDLDLIFESSLRTNATSISEKINVLCNCWKIFSAEVVVTKCFYFLILPLFEFLFHIN